MLKSVLETNLLHLRSAGSGVRVTLARIALVAALLVCARNHHSHT